jgi:uncharacterized protein (DUF58 family)
VTRDSRSDPDAQALDPLVLEKVLGLELKAKQIVEGYVSGLHRSPFRGFSVEFAEHREYVPGDDIRFLDWKVFGRTDRLYIKRYEEETNLEAHLVVDASGSMAYTDVAHRDGRGPSKFDYARWGAAALAYLITRQQDSVGLVLFDEAVRVSLPAHGNLAHLKNLMTTLEGATPSAGTGLGRALAQAAERIRRRGLVLLFSDLFDDPREVMRGLRQIRQRGNEVVLFHVLGHDEVSFPFERMMRFEGMEDATHLVADPTSLRKAYLEEVEGFRKQLRRTCMANRIDLVELDTSMNLGVVLAAYLAKRASRRRAKA